jgi:hypothetical protein
MSTSISNPALSVPFPNPPSRNIGYTRYPDWIIILFFNYLDAFKVEKIGGINLQGYFSGVWNLPEPF